MVDVAIAVAMPAGAVVTEVSFWGGSSRSQQGVSAATDIVATQGARSFDMPRHSSRAPRNTRSAGRRGRALQRAEHFEGLAAGVLDHVGATHPELPPSVAAADSGSSSAMRATMAAGSLALHAAR